MALTAGGARAREPEPEGKDPPGWLMAIVNLIVRPLDDGLLVWFPLIDSNPNRGTNVGLMPVWVLENDEGRIVMINAPSVAWNETFGVTGTWRLFLYPDTESQLRARFSWSQNVNRNASLKYVDYDLFDARYFVFGGVEWQRDGSARFFGIGNETTEDDEVNYTLDHIEAQVRFGVPLAWDGDLRVYLDQYARFDRTLPGAFDNIPDLEEEYPTLVEPDFRALAGYGLALGLDTRDSYVVPRKGVLLEAGGLLFPDHLGIDAGYVSTRFEARFITPLDDAREWVFATQGLVAQIFGDGTPFYALNTLGGKFSLRAFGEQRFSDRGVAWANAEVRHLVWDTQVRGTPVEIWLDPFVGVGEVFDTPAEAKLDAVQWVVGGALRTVARPQVVGSIDFGYGREGIAVFLDIDYSF
jgi:outer membrane protein assembly factor BamA